ncbi:MAG: diphosphomevalonate decarboxylase [bacterium]|nr:MAG: diphosphomevalonate decarboxylase [bacterium]
MNSEPDYHNADLKFSGTGIPSGKIIWRSPSNIALVKYWGKKPVQIPQNPSVSFTLRKSCSETEVSYSPAASGKLEMEFYFDGQRNLLFEEKTAKFFDSLSGIFPFVNQLKFIIHSKNTFPHSAGIASSASGMSVLSMALCDMERQFFETLQEEDAFRRKASTIARLGSGSACRSVYGGLVIWGETDGVPGTSDYYGFPVNEGVHKIFADYQDTILLVDAGEKKVSSRVGHGLMNSNPFATERFSEARDNMARLLPAMRTGDTETFIRITESEALTLHAMMMTSQPYFLLMKPNTLQIIERIFAFREKTGLSVSFTLDAGPNVHLLYPVAIKRDVKQFIDNDLRVFLGPLGYIDDRVGNGPEKIL